MTESALESVSLDLQQTRQHIEQHLDQYTLFDDDCPAHLREAIRYSLLSGGKRLRPTLVLMAARACGGSDSLAMPAACAVEMIHTYSLIHDDLPAMDDDQLRRGLPTCHIKFDEATAILAGDALIPLAFEIIAEEYPDAIAARCCRQLARACGASQLVGGQADDLSPADEPRDVERIEQIHRRKTGALFITSVKLGGLVCGATEKQLSDLETFGKNLGLSFQIVDDLLDCQGDWVKMGKLARKDQERGKLTYPELLGVEASRQRAEELIGLAITALTDFGPPAEPLRSIARFVLERNQ